MGYSHPAQNGAEQNGAEQNGTEQNGTEQNGTKQNGAEQNGAEQNGTEQNGAKQNGAELFPETKPESKNPGPRTESPQSARRLPGRQDPETGVPDYRPDKRPATRFERKTNSINPS